MLKSVKRITHFFLFVLTLSGWNSCFAQDTDSFQTILLRRIQTLQAAAGESFTQGNLPSFISHGKKSRTFKPDDNVYFAALTAYTLSNLKPFLEVDNQVIANNIINNCRSLFPHYQNKKGRPTYNFWRTDTAFSFPYSNQKQPKKGFTPLPDDLDDTSMILLAMNCPDSLAYRVHYIMQDFINSPLKRVRGSSSKYRKFSAYSSWFGKKFPVIFDVCVTSNVLGFVSANKLAWTRADSASLQYIVKVIKSRDYIRKPLLVSPYYGKTSLIIYHLARLIQKSGNQELNSFKEQLIAQSRVELNKTGSFIEKVILHTSLLRLGSTDEDFILPAAHELLRQTEEHQMPFFIGNIPSYMRNWIKIPLESMGAYIYYHFCPAYNDALLLEYLVTRQNLLKSSTPGNM